MRHECSHYIHNWERESDKSRGFSSSCRKSFFVFFLIPVLDHFNNKNICILSWRIKVGHNWLAFMIKPSMWQSVKKKNQKKTCSSLSWLWYSNFQNQERSQCLKTQRIYWADYQVLRHTTLGPTGVKFAIILFSTWPLEMCVNSFYCASCTYWPWLWCIILDYKTSETHICALTEAPRFSQKDFFPSVRFCFSRAPVIWWTCTMPAPLSLSHSKLLFYTIWPCSESYK